MDPRTDEASPLVDEASQLVGTVRHLARTRVHKISPRQIATLDKLSLRSVLAMKGYLERQPEREPVTDIPAQVGRATSAALTAAAGDPAVRTGAVRITPYAKAGGAPASDEGERHQASAQRVPRDERPQGDGYFLHDARIYKVATSQYGASKGHLFARKLDEKTGEWIPAKGMTSYLREDERITAEKAMEIGRKLSQDPSLALYGKCWICGRVLTDETSIANGKGPGPHAGMDD